jgi:hypothetical protein
MPLLALMGKTIKSCTTVGPKLKINPLYKYRFCISGNRNSNPQIPPHTRRGYSQDAESEGAILTLNAEVIPIAPKIQTAKLLKRPPIEPAANTKLSFFAKLFINVPLLVFECIRKINEIMKNY